MENGYYEFKYVSSEGIETVKRVPVDVAPTWDDITEEYFYWLQGCGFIFKDGIVGFTTTTEERS